MSSNAVKLLVRRLAPSTKRSVWMPRFEPRPMRIPKLSKQIRYPQRHIRGKHMNATFAVNVIVCDWTDCAASVITATVKNSESPFFFSSMYRSLASFCPQVNIADLLSRHTVGPSNMSQPMNLKYCGFNT